jgi:hypothetical protein
VFDTIRANTAAPDTQSAEKKTHAA